MTLLGEYLLKKSINKAEVSRKTGISTPRLSELSNKGNAKLRMDEMYLIAMAIDVDPCEMLTELCKDLRLSGV